MIAVYAVMTFTFLAKPSFFKDGHYSPTNFVLQQKSDKNLTITMIHILTLTLNYKI
jgi:hypothetical protein